MSFESQFLRKYFHITRNKQALCPYIKKEQTSTFLAKGQEDQYSCKRFQLEPLYYYWPINWLHSPTHYEINIIELWWAWSHYWFSRLLYIVLVSWQTFKLCRLHNLVQVVMLLYNFFYAISFNEKVLKTASKYNNTKTSACQDTVTKLIFWGPNAQNRIFG